MTSNKPFLGFCLSYTENHSIHAGLCRKLACPGHLGKWRQLRRILNIVFFFKFCESEKSKGGGLYESSGLSGPPWEARQTHKRTTSGSCSVVLIRDAAIRVMDTFLETALMI